MTKVSTNDNIWDMLGDQFDSSIPRLTAITIKENDYSGSYWYPVSMDRPGYYFDFSDKSSYDNPPKFRIDFAAYEYPNQQGSSSLNHIIFEKCMYYPSLVKRQFCYSNLGLKCTEYFGNPVDDAVLWRIESDCLTEGFKFKKALYTVLNSEYDFSVITDEYGVEIRFEDLNFHIAVNQKSAFGLYADERSMKASMSEGYVSISVQKGNYLVIAQNITLDPAEKLLLDFGLSSVSANSAAKVLNNIDIEDSISSSWNKWFNSLTNFPFKDRREKKAYYKCWWIIRTNYYNHPRWGRMVLEALPVYKGLWQWAIAAIEWHSDQNTENTSEWIKKALDMFTENQRDDGYITHAIYIDEENPGEGWAQAGIGTVQTPMLPWAALRYYYSTMDKDSLERWYKHFERYYEYLCRTRDEDFMDLHLWGITTSFDTGLDTTSVFQRVTYGENRVKEDFCYPAIFAAERCRYEISMDRIAKILGYNDSEWLKEADISKKAMNEHLWDDSKKWYSVLHQDGTLDTRIGVDGLFPLAYQLVEFDRAATMEEIFKRLIGQYGIRSVAQGEPGFCENTYWRGPAWPKTGSLGMETCRYYYPHLMEKVHDAVINMTLNYPNIWECCNASTGELARSDLGVICTPGVSSNVGAGEIIGSLFIYNSFDMFGIEDTLPLTEVKNFHWAGLRVSITNGNDGWSVRAEKAEKEKGLLRFIDYDGNVHQKDVQAGREEFILL